MLQKFSGTSDVGFTGRINEVFVDTALVIEGVLPGNETFEKLPHHAQVGVEEGIVVDPDFRSVRMFRGTEEEVVASEVLGISGAWLTAQLDWPDGRNFRPFAAQGESGHSSVTAWCRSVMADQGGVCGGDGVIAETDHEHMFVFVCYSPCMDAALADIAAEVAEGFAKLMLHVSEQSLSEDDVVAVRKLVDTAELVCTRTVARFAADVEFSSLGHRDVGSWLSGKTGARRTEGHARCEQARLLHELPMVDSAVLAGAFSVAHLRCLSASVTRKRLALAQRDQAVFVSAASRLDASQFALVVQRWVALADDELCDPLQPGRGDDAVFGERRLQFSRMLDGSWRLGGLFDPVAGEAIEAMLAAVTPAPSADDVRTPTQRRADGFVDLCKSFLSEPERVHLGSERPNVNVVFHTADGSAATTGGWFLRNWQLSQVMCDATFTAVAATLTGAPFDVGSPVKAIPVRNRRAVVVRDRCCRFGFCGRPARWTEIHHIRERENGGTHELSNLVLLCTYHHREVHRKGIVLRWDGPVLVATYPNGVMVHGPPHPASPPSLL